MKVIAIHTDKITDKDKNLFKFLDKYIPVLKEKSIVAITSKVIAILEGNIKAKDKIDTTSIGVGLAPLSMVPSPWHSSLYLVLKPLHFPSAQQNAS